MTTSARAFVIEVMLHDDRWHGQSEWPPSPFRLFQALVAAAARGRRLEAADEQALQWLEELEPPVIITPRNVRSGQRLQMYVPNNDLDAAGGDPDRIGEIRALKRTQPRLLQGQPRFLYIWRFEANDGVSVQVQRLMHIARRLHQFGRGVDMAWARAHLLTPEEAERLARQHGGVRHAPCAGGGNIIAVPVRGSLHSLQRRFEAARQRLTGVRLGRASQWHFRQPPKPLRRMVGYACPPVRLLFDIREAEAPETFAPHMQRHIAPFTKRLRDIAAQRLKEAGISAEKVEKYVIGRGADAQDKKRRIRIIPLPSIGHEFAGGAIRRVLVEVPRDCPLNAEDIRWAFLSECFDPESGELTGEVLVPANDMGMLYHYGIGRAETDKPLHWRTITPAALPCARTGRSGSQRLQTEREAIRAVQTTLRHAGVRARPVRIRVQREPFDRNSHRADDYVPDRFDPRQLWHVDVVFDTPVEGALVIGNGRFLGLGLMAPMENWPQQQVAVFELVGAGLPAAQGRRLLQVARAALMHLDARIHGRINAQEKPCELFSGHPVDDDGPLREGHHAHVFIAAPPDAEGLIRRLYVAPPWLVDHSKDARAMEADRALHFRDVVCRLKILYGADLPRLTLLPIAVEEHDDLLRKAAIWYSATPYVATRYIKQRDDVATFVTEDIRRELTRRALPLPERIDVLRVERATGRPSAWCRLTFAHAVSGPVWIGFGSHRGQGVFACGRHDAMTHDKAAYSTAPGGHSLAGKILASEQPRGAT